MDQFYLGTHRPQWLERTAVPLFVSRRVMPKRKFPRAIGRWALDSGGFSELSMYGEWRTTIEQYVDEIKRFSEEVGKPDFVAPMDWMCEEPILRTTGLTVEQHQERTIDNFLALRDAVGALVIPVLQGWAKFQYTDHVEMYRERGIDLTKEALVGVGTICRRQDTFAAELILRQLAEAGLRLHAFGAKIGGLIRYHDALGSSDSMAWSFNARMNPPLAGHTHKNCANCIDWALDWRRDLMERLEDPWQMRLVTVPA